MLKSEKGASSVEYAILLASIALAICSGVYFFGQTVAGQYAQAQKHFEAMAPAAPAPAPALPASPDGGGTDDGGSTPVSPGGGSGPASGQYGGGQ